MTVETSERTEDPSAELEALIEEARERARRRRLGYAVAIAAAILGLGAYLLFLGGGRGSGQNDGAGPAEDPLGAVQDAGAETYSEETLGISLQAETRNGIVWEASGLFEPSDGRFRLEVENQDPKDVFTTVIGLNGERNTVAEFDNGLFARRSSQGERCWLHGAWGPVGSMPGSISVEEAMHVTGATLESLKSETATARSGESGYEVELARSASRPQNAALGKRGRTWGDRELLAQAGAIGVLTSDAGQVRRLTIPLTDYKPYEFFNNSRLFAGGARPDPKVARVTVSAEVAPASDPLVLDRPSCHAIA